jgi:hypothetical protein
VFHGDPALMVASFKLKAQLNSISFRPPFFLIYGAANIKRGCNIQLAYCHSRQLHSC